MPRNGAGVYSKVPGTEAVSGQTVASDPYNQQVDDLANDANTPRPVVAGGTGENNAVDALAALGGLPTDPDLVSIATLGYSVRSTLVKTAANTWSLVPQTTFGDSVLALTDAAGLRSLAGLGTAALANIGTSGDTVPKNNASNQMSVAGLPLRLTNTTDAAGNQGLIIESDRATITSGDNIRLSFVLSDSAGNQDEMGRITTVASTVTSGNEGSYLQFAVMTSGAFASKARLNGVAFTPEANAGTALGSLTVGWNGANLSAGTAINWANSNYTLAHSSGLLTASGALTIGGALGFSAQGAAASYSIFRDSGSQMTYSGGTGGHQWNNSANSQALMTLSDAGDLVLAAAPGPTSVNSVGFRGLGILNTQNNAYTFALTDAGRSVYHGSGTHAFQIPPNSSVAFPLGTVIEIVQEGGTLTITEGSGVTLNRWDGTSGSGTRTVGARSTAVIQKTDTNSWIIMGAALT